MKGASKDCAKDFIKKLRVIAVIVIAEEWS
jgi:hypothetical protein